MKAYHLRGHGVRRLLLKTRAWAPSCYPAAAAPLRALSGGGGGAPIAASSALLSEADFHRLADALLASIELRATPLEDAGLEGFDLTSSQGVLTLRLGRKGTYVLNKQTPNKQVWWSSPLSGPRRYAWSAAAGAWVSTRDGSCLLRTLREELKGLTGADLPFSEPLK
jgi:frataxin